MKHSLLIGEKSALFIENNELFKKKIVDFNDLQNMGIKDVRIISNRADVEFRIGFIPKVYPWQSSLVRKSYILGNSFEDKYFNADIRKDTLQQGKYKTQDVSLTPDTITKSIIDLYTEKTSGIEHMSLIVPKILEPHGYWIFVGENLLGGYSIYCGLDEFVLFVRSVNDRIVDEVSKTILFLERFGYKTEYNLEKVCVMGSPIEGFKCLHNGFGDEFLLARLFEQSLPITPTIGPEKWALRSMYEVYLKYALSACIAIAILLMCSNIFHYHKYSSSYEAYDSLIPQTKIITGQADSLLKEITDNLKYELQIFDSLNDEFNSIRSDISYTSHLDNMDLLNTRREPKPQTRRSMPQRIIVSEWISNEVLRKLQSLIPENMTVSGYTYQATKHNGKSCYDVSIAAKAKNDLIQQFIENVKRYIDKSVKIELKNNRNETHIKMRFESPTDQGS